MEQEELKLMPYARALWRRKWLILLTTIGALAAGIGATFLDSSETEPESRFQAVATLRIEDQAPSDGSNVLSTLQLLTGGEDTQSAQTHIEVIQSSAVMGRTVNKIRESQGLPVITDSAQLAEAAGLLAEDVRVSQISGSNLLMVSTIATDLDTATLQMESIVSAYQQFLRDQKQVSTQDAIDSIDRQIGDSSQPAVTSTRLKIFVEQLSTSDISRVNRAIVSSQEQIDALDLSQFNETPMLQGLVTELGAASARLQTASLGLEALELDLNDDSGSLAAIPGKQTIENVQELTSASLLAVQAIRTDYVSASRTADLNSGIADLANVNLTLTDAANTFGVLSGNLGVPAEDRAQMSLLRSQVLALHGSNQNATSDILTRLNLGQETDADRQRLSTQLNASASTLGIVLTSLTSVRQTQTSPTAVTQIVNIEGILQNAILETSTSATDLLANINNGPGPDLDRLENLLDNGIERLNVIELQLGAGSTGDQLLNAKIDGAASIMRTAADLARSLTENARLSTVSSSADLLPVENQLDTGVSLLAAVSANLAIGSSLTNQILIDRVDQSRDVVESAMAETDALMVALSDLDEDGPAEPILLKLDTASPDLTDIAISTRSTRQIIEATAAAGVSQPLADRLTRIGNDLTIASGIFSDTALGVSQAAEDMRNTPVVLLGLASGRLESASSELSAATALVDELRVRANSGELLTLSDAGDLDARLQIIQASLVSAGADISQIPSTELGLTAQNLRSVESRLRTVSAQLSDIESAETAALDDLFGVRRELQIVLLSPQETGVGLVDTDTDEIPASDGSSLPFDASVLVAAFGGLLLGLIGAVSLEFMDRTVRRPEEISEIARVPSLGLLPQGLAKGNPHPPEVTDDPTSIFSEAVHLVTTQIQGRVNNRSRLLLVSSPRPREGKTMMAINLAKALSLRSLKVLLIDANFRKPDTSKIFEFENEPGLATALTQNRDPEEFVKTVEEGRLYVLPAGSSLVPPVELISRPRTAALLARVREEYDFVIIDGPPTLGFSESNALAKLAGAVIMVARAGVTKKASLREATENLAGTEVLGVVMNFVSPKDLSFLEHRDYVGKNRSRKWLPSLPGFVPFSKN